MTNRFEINAKRLRERGPTLPDAVGPYAFLLDVDGTLLDIAPTPAEVRASDTLRATLARLERNNGGAVALVSGRLVGDLDRIFAPLKLPAVGGHGAEFRATAGAPSSEVCAPALDIALKGKLATIAKIDPGILIEDKVHSLAVHYRLAADKQRAIEETVAAICLDAPPGSVDILPGKCVVEIKAAGFTKGSAVRRLMSAAPFAGRRPIFVGDDTTDVSAFAVLPEFGGIGLSVGELLPGAVARFEAPCDVRDWLNRISRSAGHPTP